MTIARRGLLRGIAGALSAPALMQARAAASAFMPGHMLGGGVGGGFGTLVGGVSVEQGNSAWSLLRKAMKPHQKVMARRQAVTSLCGGMPPHIAALQSVSPSYRALMAAKWGEEQQEKHEGVYNALCRKFGLPCD